MIDKNLFLNQGKNSDIIFFKIKSKFLVNLPIVQKFVRFINKYLYKINFFGAAINRYENTLSIFSAKKDKSLYAKFKKQKIFCNFGSGGFYHNFWINFDFPAATEKYKSIQGKKYKDFRPIDLCEANLNLPFQNETVDLIYCSHTIEHLEEQKAITFLKECSRILKTAGVIRLAFPSLENNFYFSKIINEQQNIPEEIKKNSIITSSIEALTSSENVQENDLINEIRKNNYDINDLYKNISQKFKISKKFDYKNPGRHISFWSHEKLSKLSNSLGFKFYLPFYKGSSLTEPFKNTEVFDTTESQWSLYGELIK
jgi:predicted SAM-dependent methyltransferase